jgi:hypothetical protein
MNNTPVKPAQGAAIDTNHQVGSTSARSVILPSIEMALALSTLEGSIWDVSTSP